MDPVDAMWRGVAVPSLVSGVLLLISTRPWKRVQSLDRGGACAVPAAVAAGYAAGHLALVDWAWPGFPPADTTHWPLFLGGLALLVAGFETLRPAAGTVPRWTGRLLLAGAAMAVVLLPQFRSGFTPALALWLGALTAGSLLWWASVETAARSLPQLPFFATLLVLLSGASAALVISGTGLIAQLVGALAAAVGPLLLLSLLKKRFSPAPLLAVVSVVLASLWANGLLYSYADLQGISALLLAAAVAPVATGWLPAVRRMGESPRTPVRWAAATFPAAAAIIPLAAAVALALSNSPELTY